MDRIKRFIDIYVPVTSCTFRCHYCYITHHRLFGNKLPELKYSPEVVRKALSKQRLGGPCLINFCGGGETLLPEKTIDYIRVLLEEGHYVMVVTNASVSKRFEQIAAFPADLMKRLFFKFSYHYIELKKRNRLDTFFSNVKRMRDAGASFTIEATPSDELIPYIDEMKEVCLQNLGAINHVTVARDERQVGELPILTSHTREEYRRIWSTFKSEFFDFKESIFGQKRTEFCYAGDWSIYVNIGTGMMTQCYCSYYQHNIFDHPERPIPFHAIGHKCGQLHCYNGHAFLALGDIPELTTPTYAALRNRVCIDGSEWLKPEMKSFMSTKLIESNEEYSVWEKIKTDQAINFLLLKNKIKRAIKRIIKR